MSIFIDLKTDRLLNERLQNCIQFDPTTLVLHTHIGRDFWKLVHQDVYNGYLYKDFCSSVLSLCFSIQVLMKKYYFYKTKSINMEKKQTTFLKLH